MEVLDRAILDWIAEHTGDATLAEQIARAEISKRDYTRTGFFLYFKPATDQPEVPAGVRPVNPHIESPDLMDGAGCNLFLRAGHLHYLEVYARGGFMPEQLERFELRAAA